jgi:hypothetical protein
LKTHLPRNGQDDLALGDVLVIHAIDDDLHAVADERADDGRFAGSIVPPTVIAAPTF